MKKAVIVYLIGIVLSILYILFSLFAIWNLASLYKDQIEFPTMTGDCLSSNKVSELLNYAKELNNEISFFTYTSIASTLVLIFLAWKVLKFYK